MSNVININFQDTIISQWEEAVDKESAEKTLAFKYLQWKQRRSEQLLIPKGWVAAAKNTFCFSNCQQLELL